MTSSQYLTYGLIVIGIGLLLAEYYITKWRLVIGGFGVNILAAGAVLLITQLLQKDWSVLPIFVGGIISSAAILPIALLRIREVRVELAKAQDTLRHNAEVSLAHPSVADSGIKLYARNYTESGGPNVLHRFHELTQRDFGDYARNFILSSPQGSSFKIIGIDWTELFGAAVSGTSERYLSMLFDRRANFQIILLDPRTAAPLEKRFSEFDLVIDGKKRYERNFPLRVYGKIIGAVEMLSEYHRRFPEQVKFKFVPEVPAICCIMNGTQILFHPYTRCHKGWDSPVFVADRKTDGVYGFWEEYFDFLWNNPKLRIQPDEWAKSKLELVGDLARFRSIVLNSCSGPGHENCEKLLNDQGAGGVADGVG